MPCELLERERNLGNRRPISHGGTLRMGRAWAL
jgi:hypothetical protein